MTKPEDALHGAIMNLQPRRTEEGLPMGWSAAYLEGHRDARHAAAKLALSALTLAQAERDTARQERDELRAALRRLESAVDWHLGRSGFTQTVQLKGVEHSAAVRKELFAAHDAARAALAPKATQQANQSNQQKQS